MRRRLAIPCTFALLLLFGSGCTAPAASSTPTPYGGPKNLCQRQDDCIGESSCSTVHHLCVNRETAAGRTYFLKVIPLGSRAAIFEVTLDEAAKAEVRLEPLEEVTLPVRTEGDLTINAEVLVTDVGGAIPGRPPEIFSYEAFESPLDETQKGLVTLALFPGESRYRIEIIPYGVAKSLYPRTYLTDISVIKPPSNTKAELRGVKGNLLSTLTLYKGPTAVNGRVTRGGQYVDGLLVEVIDPTTRHVLSTQFETGCISNTQKGAICGEFQLKMIEAAPPIPTSEPASEPPASVFRVSYPHDGRYPVVVNPTYEVIDGLYTIALEPVSTPVGYHARVEKPVPLAIGDVQHDGLEGCLAAFESDDVSGGSASVAAVTDSLGKIDLYLFWGNYRVTITPPAVFPGDFEDFALLEENRLIESSGTSEMTNQVFSLVYRPKIKVRVTFAGQTITGSSITADPVDRETTHARSSYSTVDPDGALALWLDPGRHRLTTMAPVDSGFGFDLREIVVMSDPALEDGPVEIPLDDIIMTPPMVAEVFLVSDAIDVAGAEVEWYEMAGDDAILVGRVTANAKGKVTALLPPIIPSGK